MKKGTIFVFGIIFLIISIVSVFATPREIYNCGATACSLLSIPRYKIAMSQNDPNTIWLMFGHASYDNFIKTINGGNTWDATTPDALNIRNGLSPYLSDHSSISFDNLDNLYVADRSSSDVVSYFIKINAPGETTSDWSSEQNIPCPTGTGAVEITPNIIAQDSQNIFVFFRNRLASGNIWYTRSTDGGSTFLPIERVTQTGSINVRIGSFLIEGKPAVIIHYVDIPADSIDYRYFVWNGSQFIANPDSDVVTGEGIGNNRAYSMNYVNGYIHLVYNNRNNELRHAWKRYNDGSSVWHNQVIDSSPYLVRVGGWMPSLSVHGNNLYVFYAKQQSDSVINNNVYYKIWDSTTQTWSQVYTILADGQDNEYPQGPQIVNPSANYIPVAWTRNGQIWYDTIPVSGYTCTDADTDTYYLYNAVTCPMGNDCNDANSAIHPGATEICGNGVDEDCSGADLVCSISPDVNSDGKINIIDLALTTFWQGKNNGQGDWNLFQHIDLDSDGKVSFTDVLRVITGM